VGYEISCVDSTFRVLDPKAALAALKAANRAAPLFDYDEIEQDVEDAETLGDALAACCWDVEEDADGRIDKLFYEGKLLTDFDDLERLFHTLAPFVRPGCFLAIEGEDGASWRYQFARGRLKIREEG